MGVYVYGDSITGIDSRTRNFLVQSPIQVQCRLNFIVQLGTGVSSMANSPGSIYSLVSSSRAEQIPQISRFEPVEVGLTRCGVDE